MRESGPGVGSQSCWTNLLRMKSGCVGLLLGFRLLGPLADQTNGPAGTEDMQQTKDLLHCL